jgi:cellobiose-specific phosphotransferase system component IIC
MSAKWSVTSIARAHFATYTDARTGKPLVADYLAFLGAPAAVALAASTMATMGKFQLIDVARLLGGIGVFTGLLFGLLTNTFTVSLRVRRDEGLDPEHPVVKQVAELFANLGWAVVVGCLLVSLIVTAGATHPTEVALGPGWTGILVFLFLHLMMTVLMALKRLWHAHQKIADLPPKNR